MKELGVDGDIPVAWVKQVPDFNQADGVQAFVRDLRAISYHFKTNFGVRLGLVFVDTVSASFDIKEEADNAEAARICKVMREDRRCNRRPRCSDSPLRQERRSRTARRVSVAGQCGLRAVRNGRYRSTNRQCLQSAIGYRQRPRRCARGARTLHAQAGRARGRRLGPPWGSMVAVAEAAAAQPA